MFVFFGGEEMREEIQIKLDLATGIITGKVHSMKKRIRIAEMIMGKKNHCYIEVYE